MNNFSEDDPAHYNKLTKDKDDLADTINNAQFALELTASTDVYRTLGELNVKVQDPELFPWQVSEIVEEGVADLRDISHRLRNGETSPENRTDKPFPADE